MSTEQKSGDVSADKVVKSEQEWRAKLSEQEYQITRQAGTERAFTGEYNGHKEDGEYLCKCCGVKLFDSETKYDSGSGWPSFSSAEGIVGERADSSHGMQRVEVLCQRCDAHLGHVFEDGPGPDGLRYCINSASLDFSKRED